MTEPHVHTPAHRTWLDRSNRFIEICECGASRYVTTTGLPDPQWHSCVRCTHAYGRNAADTAR
jgi:hypothetical protein